MEINDISLSIGELRADAKNTRDAVMRIEKNIDRISGSLSNLPPSPVCMAKHEQIDRLITDIRLQNAKTATIISGLVAALTVFGKYMLTMIGFIPPAGP